MQKKVKMLILLFFHLQSWILFQCCSLISYGDAEDTISTHYDYNFFWATQEDYI